MENNELKKDKFVFVYGSLQKGFINDYVMEAFNAEFIGKGYTKNNNFAMIDMGAYPAILLNDDSKKIKGDKRISGELYAVDEMTMVGLDTFEGCPTYYYNKIIDVEVNNKSYKASMYLLNPKTSRLNKTMTVETPTKNPKIVLSANDVATWKE